MRGSTTNSADMKSKVLDITQPQWWEASVFTKIPSLVLRYIQQACFVNTSDLNLYALQCSPTKRLFFKYKLHILI